MVLKLNISKTTFIIFKTKNKKCLVSRNIIFGTDPLDRDKSTQFLGVILNEKLTWDLASC